MSDRDRTWRRSRAFFWPQLAAASLSVLLSSPALFSAEEDADSDSRESAQAGESDGTPVDAPITIDDLEYGRIDVDGDGKYTRGDDLIVRQLVENHSEHLENALKTAKRRTDGGVDLSSYFSSDRFDGARIYEERLRKKLESGQLTALVINRWEDRENREAGQLGALGQLHKTVDFGIDLYATITSDGQPVEGATLVAKMVDPESESEWHRRLSFARGRFRSRANGFVEASIAGTETFEKPLEEYRFELGAYHPELGSAHKAYTYDELRVLAADQLVLRLERGLTLRGRVLARDGRGVPGARVQLEATSPDSQPIMSGLTVSSGEDGSFTMAGIRFDNRPRNLEVTFEGEWPVAAQTSPEARGTRHDPGSRVGARVPIELSADQKVGTIAVPEIFLSLGESEPIYSTQPVVEETTSPESSKGASPPTREGRPARFSAQVSVRVVVDGRPMEGATIGTDLVRLRNGYVDKGDPFRQRHTRGSNAEGIAVTEFGMSTSSYAGDPDDAIVGVGAYHPEHGSAYGEVRYGDLLGPDAPELVLELRKRLVLEGKVVDRNGAPIPDAQVRLDSSWLSGYPSMSGITVRTRADGRFTLAGVGFKNTPRSLHVSYGGAPRGEVDISRLLSRDRDDNPEVTATISFGPETQDVVGLVVLPDIKLSVDVNAE